MQTQLINFAKEQQTRVAELLKNADPLTEEYKTGLQNLTSLYWFGRELATPIPDPCFQGTPSPASEVAPEPPISSVEEPTEEPERNDDDPEVEHPHYTKEYVRGRLSDARINDNVDIAEIIHKLGYPNFSAIPEDKYWRVMAELSDATEGNN